MIIQVCIGSSCHLKGSHDVVKKFQDAIELFGYKDDITLAGSFCIGECMHKGVTVQINDEGVKGVTTENFNEIWQNYVVKGLEEERA